MRFQIGCLVGDVGVGGTVTFIETILSKLLNLIIDFLCLFFYPYLDQPPL